MTESVEPWREMDDSEYLEAQILELEGLLKEALPYLRLIRPSIAARIAKAILPSIDSMVGLIAEEEQDDESATENLHD